jgi:hypothetical protein
MDQLAPVTYIVLDHKTVEVDVGNRVVDATIMSLAQNPKLVSSPDTNVLLCFAPRLGTTGPHAIIPSVVFWTDRFWVPFLDITPSRVDLARELQLGGVTYNDDKPTYPFANVDVLYEIDVTNIPDLDWGLFNH